MQESRVDREILIKLAAEKLATGEVDRVLGWKKGEFDYDVTPAVFESAGEMQESFVYNDFCGANFSKYLIRETGKTQSRVLVFLKPCDTYSLNQLLTEHRLDREKVYAVGVPCHGMIDVSRVRELADGIRSITVQEETVTVETLYDGEKTAERILAYRDTYGKFVTTQQLLDVEGIGEGLLEKLRPYVYVEE